MTFNIEVDPSITSHLLMVRPLHFGFNEETAPNNAFQVNDKTLSIKQIADLAIKEFDDFVCVLRENGLTITLVDDDISIPFNGESGIYLYKNNDNWIGGIDSGEGNSVVGETCLSYNITSGNWNYRNYIGYPSKSTNVLTGIFITGSKYERFAQSFGGHNNYIGNAKSEAVFIEDSTNITFNHNFVGIDSEGEVVTNIGNGFDLSRCYNCKIENGYIAGSQIGINVSDTEGLDIRGNYIGFNSEFYVEDGNRDYGILLSSCSNTYIRY